MSRPAVEVPAHTGLEIAQDTVRRRFGLVTHDHQRAGFEQALNQITRSLGYASREAYLEALAQVDRGQPEVETLLSAITVGESYFFRDAAQLELLEKRWIPEIVARERNASRTIRVWSAGCSHGQEIYTVAMLLDRHLPRGERWDLQLLATDINREALATAVEGRYREWSLRATPQWARSCYFEERGREWLIAPRIRSVPRFENFNLVDAGSPWPPAGIEAFDLILCRNVFIYFDRDAVQSVMSRFSDCLDPDGLVLLGPADIVTEGCEGLALATWGRAQYYCRSGSMQRTPSPRTAPSCSAKKSRPAATAAFRADGADGAPCARRASAKAQTEAVDEQLRRGAWEAAALGADAWLARHGETAGMLERSARAKASLGRLDEALVAVDRALVLEGLNRDAHFTRGLVLLERDDGPAAERALRRAVYLDKGFLEAHYYLASLLLQSGRRDAGLKSLRNALAIAERGDSGAALKMVPDLTYGDLAAILDRELAARGATTAGARM